MKTIFNISDEMLVEIVLYLTPRERLPLSKTCTRFNSLIFEDGKTLRYLDFSNSGHSDVEEYFGNEITSKLIRGVSLKNAIIADRLSDSFIAKAINLVDVNLLGIEMNIKRLEALLNPLEHLKRLSFEWSNLCDRNLVFDHRVILKQRFRGLIYLSVDTTVFLFKPLVSLMKWCQELKELYIVENPCRFASTGFNITLLKEFPLPKSIEVIDYYGAMALEFKQKIRGLLSNPEEWTDFRKELCDAYEEDHKFHMERNVQVCDELLDHGTVKCARYDPAKNPCNVGRVLIPADLLREVVAMRHENVPTEFCCLSNSGSFKCSCSMTIKDAKRLLKDSSYQLPSLRLHHRVEMNCDVHLIASAFPYLTELHLSGIILEESAEVERSFEERLMRKGDATPLREPRDSMNRDLSFKTLVRNTPRLRHLTFEASRCLITSKPCDSGASSRCTITSKHCDFAGLGLIAGWKSLETLVSLNMPLVEGLFLLEIAKQCKNLKNIHVSDSTYERSPNPFYKERFSDLFTSCENLRNININGYSLSKPSQVFNLLQNYPLIESIELCFTEYDDTPDDLTRSIEQLLDRCSQLTRFCLGFKDVDKELKGEQSHRNLVVSFHNDLLYLTRGQFTR